MAAQTPAKIEAKIRELELELSRTCHLSAEARKNTSKGDRKLKELQFQVFKRD